MAGTTTFLTTVYIALVNPLILEAAGMDFGAVFVATCLAAAIGCFMMGFFANYPIALGPGMGLNAFFSFTVVGQMGYSWQVALGAVFFSGICFLILSICGVRQWLINGIPRSLQGGISAGIGLFLGFLGLKSAGIVIASPNTLVTIGNMTSWSAFIACVGFMIIAALYARGFNSSVMIGILSVTLLSFLAGQTTIDGVLSMPPDLSPTFLAMDISGALKVGLIGIVLSFLFVDMFDTSGTLIAVARKGNLLDKEGNLPRINKALIADSTASIAGAMLGTSTTTSMIESCAGITAGGRTGLTAVVVGLFFIACLFFYPLASAIPSYATAPALFFTAVLMTHSLTYVDWNDITEAAPVGVAAIAMPLTFSIANGIALAIISWTGIKLLSGRYKEITPAMLTLSTLFILHFVL